MLAPAIQLFTLKDVDEPIESTLERVADTNYRGVEFAGLGSASATEVAATLEATDLTAVGAHVGIDELEDKYEEMRDAYETVGTRRIVVPSYDTTAFATAKGVDAAAERLSNLAARLDDDGFEMLYHNHTFEFTDLDGETAMDRLVERTDDLVGLEIDTGLAKHAGADPVELLDRYADRVSLLHLTDTRSGSDRTLHVNLGDGEVDLRACLETARDIGVDWVVYENGRTTDPLESLASSDATLSRLLSE